MKGLTPHLLKPVQLPAFRDVWPGVHAIARSGRPEFSYAYGRCSSRVASTQRLWRLACSCGNDARTARTGAPVDLRGC